METLTFLTGNPGKVEEVEGYLKPLGFEVVSHQADWVEPQAEALIDVATAKAQQARDAGVHGWILVEDSGLFIHSLRGFPGVNSAAVQSQIGNTGILKLLADVEAELRTAHFETAMILVSPDGDVHAFVGRCQGVIASASFGEGGFGYDPIFQPENQRRTFAELSREDKATVSHRGRALAQVVDFLRARFES